jgi:hypothetical protein
MFYISNNKIFNYINYFTLSCIIPIGYFAPMGEWLLLTLIALATIINGFINKKTIHLNNILIVILSILIVIISFFWSINSERTLEVIGPITGILIAIYISLNISSNNRILNIENIIGFPLILISICILLDIILKTEIRSTLAIMAGDAPTSKSANFSRGIIIITMIMPLIIALYIHKNKKLMALFIFLLVSSMVLLGPNEASKVAFICTIISSTIIYFLGPKSFLYFGIISYIFILFLPIISTTITPKIGNINKSVIFEKEKIVPFSYILKHSKGGDLNEKKINSALCSQNGNIHSCKQIYQWQETPLGGSIIHRLLVWEYVGKKIHEKPFLGHGAGTSRLIGQNIILNIPNTKKQIKGAIPLHPHNNFLEIWLELGLLGIIVISLLWIKIIKFGINIRKKSYVLGTGVCASIVSIFVIANLSFGVFQAWWMASIGLTFLIMLKTYKHTE